MCFNILSWFFSDEASNFGTLLGGASAAIAVFFAIFAARKEIERWKRQKKYDSTTQTAAKAFIASHQLLNHLEIVLNATTEGGTLEANYHRRMILSGDACKKFYDAEIEAKVFLTNEINALLETIWKTWFSLTINAEMYIDLSKTELKDEQTLLLMRELYNSSFGNRKK